MPDDNTSGQGTPWRRLYSGHIDETPSLPFRSLPEAWRHRVATAPDRCALRYFDGELSASQVDLATDALAVAFQDRGIGAGDRVGLCMQNIPYYPLCMLALWKIRATAVPFNPMYRGEELRRLADDAQLSGVVAEDEVADEVETALTTAAGPWMLTVSAQDLRTQAQSRGVKRTGAGASSQDVGTLIGGYLGSTPRTEEATGEDVAVISYTSGTTGPPKGALNTHANILHSSRNFAQWIDLRPGDTILALAPLFHITGLSLNMAIALLADTTLVMTGRFRAESVIKAIAENNVSYTVGSITAYNAFMKVPWAGADHFRTLTRCYTGGAPVPPSTVIQLRERFGLEVRNAWGMTETTAGGIATPLHLEAPVHTPSGSLSVGVPMQNVSVRILDQDGTALPVGQEGELEVEAPQNAVGYWRNPDATALSFPEGRLRTGDVAVMDEDGWIYLVDRLKDMINVSGFKVWPREVEDVLYEHPDVFEVAVVGEPDEYRGETVVAYVSLNSAATATSEELVEFARGRLAAYKCPRRIYIVDDVPKTATGKIKRGALRSVEASTDASVSPVSELGELTRDES
jgi:long-chain acyl-CoA synthetase